MKKSSIEDLVSLFRSLSIKEGDNILCFSKISSLGLVENGVEGVLSALNQAIGDNSHFIVPTFSFSFCKQEVFDVQNTESNCGNLTNFVRSVDGAYRSVHPNHSFTGLGPDVKSCLKMNDKTSFGVGSALKSMLDRDFKVLQLGIADNTYIHYVEELVGVEYRFSKSFTGTINDHAKVYEDTFELNVKRLGLEGLQTQDRLTQKRIFWDSQYCTEVKSGYGRHRLFSARDYCDFHFDCLDKDPLYFVDKEKYYKSLELLDKNEEIK